MANEKKAGKHGLLNVFDIAVLAVIAVLVVVLFVTGRETADESVNFTANTTVRYMIELTGLEEGSASSIEPGDVVIDRIKKFNLGTVESVEVVPTTRRTVDYVNGTTVDAEVPGQETALIIITAEATESDTEILLDLGYPIRVGTAVNVKISGCWGRGYVLVIERGDAA